MNNRYSYGLSVIIPSLLVAFILGLLVNNWIRGEKPEFSFRVNTPVVPIEEKELDIFWRAWNILDERLPSASSTSDQDKIYGAIKGLASSYGDPYTVFFPPEESKIFNENISGNFSGVGMEIGIKNGQLQVVSPLKGTPAERAGVKSGDFILTINGTSTAEMSVDRAVSYIRGPKGTEVTILFLPKESSKPIEKKIIRDIIQIPTLETSNRSDGIFVIKLFSFSAQSSNLFRSAMGEFIKSGNEKLIIDMRGNPGGYLEAAVDIASMLLPQGSVIVTEDFGNRQEPVIFRAKAGKNMINSKTKVVILVDGGSASASEIVAGALRENNVAKLVGTKTFGKGSVQELVPLNSESALKITIANWLTPNGHNLSKDGLTPDYEVKITEKDVDAGKDPQMDKAIEVLKGM